MTELNNGVPVITICIVTYNQQAYIRECLDSVLSQQVSVPFEVIVSDDGSTDSTRDILHEYANRYPNLKLVLRPQNLGALKNFVATHDLATGDYVCHLDGDDRWLPGKLESQFQFLSQNKDFNACWTRTNLFNDQGGFVSGFEQNFDYFENLEVDFAHALRVGIVAPHCSLMYRKSARMSKEDGVERIDLFYTWEFLSMGKGKILDNCLAEYRLFSTGAITRNSGVRIKKMYIEHADYFVKKYPQYANDIFVFVFLNFLLDFKNKRSTAGGFFKLSLKTLSFKAVMNFASGIRTILKMKPKRLN
mgnify:CR=1 FL=1